MASPLESYDCSVPELDEDQVKVNSVPLVFEEQKPEDHHDECSVGSSYLYPEVGEEASLSSQNILNGIGEKLQPHDLPENLSIASLDEHHSQDPGRTDYLRFGHMFHAQACICNYCDEVETVSLQSRHRPTVVATVWIRPNTMSGCGVEIPGARLRTVSPVIKSEKQAQENSCANPEMINDGNENMKKNPCIIITDEFQMQQWKMKY